jgi:hypothetical protein
MNSPQDYEILCQYFNQARHRLEECNRTFDRVRNRITNARVHNYIVDELNELNGLALHVNSLLESNIFIDDARRDIITIFTSVNQLTILMNNSIETLGQGLKNNNDKMKYVRSFKKNKKKL